jgi:hypothetical protein
MQSQHIYCIIVIFLNSSVHLNRGLVDNQEYKLKGKVGFALPQKANQVAPLSDF